MALCPTIEAKKVWDNTNKSERIDIIDNLKDRSIGGNRLPKNLESKSWSKLGPGTRQELNESMEDIGFCLNEFSSARCTKSEKKKNNFSLK